MWIIAVVGLTIVAVGFVYDLGFAGLPYQDPPPDLQACWLFHKSVAAKIMTAGALIAGIGMTGGLVRMVAGRPRR